MFAQLILGAAASLLVSGIAFSCKALTLDGAFAAACIGTAVFGAGGLPAAAVLLAFFVSAALLSRAGSVRKRRLHDWGKQGPRDARQVIANGGAGAVCIALHRFDALLAVAFCGAFAAAAADTWSTEIGTLAGKARSILTFQPVASGASGGVTLVGTMAQAAGAALVAFAGFRLHLGSFCAIAIGGFSGGLFDSILGASVQALRWCPHCGRQCETNPHAQCGTPTTVVRGLRWIDNDVVNWLATVCGAFVAALVASRWSVLP